MLTGLEGGDRDLSVGIARGADINDVDILAFEYFSVVGGELRPAESFGSGSDPVFIAPHEDDHLRLQGKAEGGVSITPSVGMDLTHEGIPNERDSQ